MSKALLNDYYAALRDGDFEALARIVSPDVTVRYFGPPGLLPWVGVHEGFEAYRRFLTQVREALGIVEVVQEAVIAEGDWVVVLGRGRWRAKATQRDIAVNMTNAFRFAPDESGRCRVAEYRVYTDTATFAAALKP
ncbi:MAG: nuclear transport factor 2 family protein [Ferrovibrio sp.]|uniref:nuclear transport factor 2 family protein n=1 Tax=Ferrovibrio sp. TaxID=1917215 RepID=UPI00391BC572